MNNSSIKIHLLLVFIFGVSCSSIQNFKDASMATGLEELQNGNTDNAKIVFQSRCDLDERSGCAQLGFILEKENQVLPANLLFKKACDLGDLNSCSIIGFSYLRQQKIEEAKLLLEKSSKSYVRAQIALSFLKYIEKKSLDAKFELENMCNKQFTFACNLRGIIAEYEEDFTPAKKYYTLGLSSGDFETNIRLGMIELILGNRQSGEILVHQSCISNSPKACRIDWLLQLQKKDPSLDKTLKLKCEKKDKEACYYLGLQTSLNQKTISLSPNFFKRACDLGNGYGCIELKNSMIPYSDPALEIKLAKEACEKGAGSACSIIYLDYYLNNEFIALNSLEQGCRLKDGNSCMNLGHYLWHNNKIKESLIKYQESCTNKFSTGCFWAIQSSSVPQNEKDVKLKSLCKENLGIACETLAFNLKKIGNMALAHDYFKQACNLKYPESCYESMEIETSTNKSINRIEALSKLCDQKIILACFYVGEHYQKERNNQKAKEAFLEGCYMGSGGSCSHLGFLYKEESKLQEASDLFQRACDLGSIYGCNHYKQ